MISFLKSKDFTVKDPKFNIGKDAGIDLFVPAYNKYFEKVFEEENPGMSIEKNEDGKYFIRVAPHSDVLINTGLYTRFPSNIALIGFNKSGVSTKQKLVVGACVDDASYEGLLHLHVINTSNDHQNIYLDNKLVQWVPVLIDTSGVDIFSETEMTKEKFFEDHKSDRKDKGFGSTSLDH